MFRLSATTFNDKTWQENVTWRTDNKHAGCIYCNPRKLKETIPIGATIFVLEMHNDENKIKGIGMIKKQPLLDKAYRVYIDGNYNRYVFKSPYRIDINDLPPYEKAIVEMFDVLLFKSKKHIKRIQGIAELPAWILNTKQFNFVQFFKDLFQQKFSLAAAATEISAL